MSSPSLGSTIRLLPNLIWLNTSQTVSQKEDSVIANICGPSGTQFIHSKLLRHWKQQDSKDTALRMKMSNRIRYSWVSIGKRNWNPFHLSPKEEEGWQSFWSKNPRLAVTPNRGRNMMLIFPSQGQEILHQMIDMRNRRDQDKEVQMQPKDSLTIRISRMTILRPSPTSSITWPGKVIKESRLGTPANQPDKEEPWHLKMMKRCLIHREKSF